LPKPLRLDGFSIFPDAEARYEARKETREPEGSP